MKRTVNLLLLFIFFKLIFAMVFVLLIKSKNITVLDKKRLFGKLLRRQTKLVMLERVREAVEDKKKVMDLPTFHNVVKYLYLFDF